MAPGVLPPLRPKVSKQSRNKARVRKRFIQSSFFYGVPPSPGFTGDGSKTGIKTVAGFMTLRDLPPQLSLIGPQSVAPSPKTPPTMAPVPEISTPFSLMGLGLAA